MLPQQFTAQIISHARADEGAEDLDDPSSQEEGKGAASQGRSQAQLRRGVLVPDPVDLIQMGVKLICGHRARLLAANSFTNRSSRSSLQVLTPVY